jgi:hypothetical protein
MIRRTALPLAAAALLAGCGGPDLEPTEGGYAPGMVPAAAEDTAATPLDEPAPVDGDPAAAEAADSAAGNPAGP